MKKSIAIILTTVLAICLMTGCSMNSGSAPSSPPMQQSVQAQQNTNEPDVSAFIGEEAAKELALKKAEITANDVTFDRVELDRDDGVWRYEIEFRQGGTEYSADINAEDGTVLSWEVDKD